MTSFNSYVSLTEGNLCGVFEYFSGFWMAMSGIGFPIYLSWEIDVCGLIMLEHVLSMVS
jgi:hypothetical protein